MRIILVNFSFSFFFFVSNTLQELLSKNNLTFKFQSSVISTQLFFDLRTLHPLAKDEKTNFSFTVLQVRCGKNTTLCLHSFGLLVSSRNEEKISPA